MLRKKPSEKRRADIRGVKVSKRMAIASAIIALLTFIVKEVVQEHFKELHDSVAQAERQFRTEQGQSIISSQIMLEQQQAEIAKLKEDPKLDPKVKDRDFSVLIDQGMTSAHQAIDKLNSDFDRVSRLIDAFPEWAKDFRESRDKARVNVEKVNATAPELLKPSPDHDLAHYVQVKSVMVLALLNELPVVLLGAEAVTAGERLERASDHLIRICTWAIYCLSILALSLGLYAAIKGKKTESAE